ncbi:MAG TPA: phenylalanine--tRNA ligase subunit beta [Bryobacteraceae bacterium]|jgi:phenylalanyl-tRNA synthetase beta chain|nr:phenylalanine--tRNA ligase subunit beta [Bryobacteraceae bacterium]
MKFSYNWLADSVPGLSTSASELQRLITMKTAECEAVDPVGAHFKAVVAARVLALEPMTKGKNQRVTIDAGTGQEITVVCGAPNVHPDMIAAWVPPGVALHGKTIGKAIIEGIESDGMLASPAELGISRDHSGLLELESAQPGMPIPGLAADWVIEIDNKSLTHRPDLWGHLGMAREVAAITGGTLADPVKLDALPSDEPAIKIEVANPALCPRYSALVLENVKVGPSPLWLQARLESVGLNPINNIVDVTNYILAELPQPMHAFDGDELVGGTILVRTALPGERLAALNGESYDLDPADLVIADAAGPIALAGVIGGSASAISEETTRIVLESANFLAASIRLTSARHKLRTDASMRFEKSLDPENTVRGLARALELLKEACPGIRVVGGVADAATPRIVPAPIPLPVSVVVKKLGAPVSADRVRRILSDLGFAVQVTAPDLFSVTVPSWRATKDISLPDDLVEEVGRMVGYGEIAPAPPLVAATVPPANPMRLYLRQVRAQMASQGFTETYNYSFVNQTDLLRFDFDPALCLTVRNPVASEWTHIRPSLLPGLFNNIVSNVRNYAEFRLFEIGHEVRLDRASGEVSERTHSAATIYSAQGDERDFFELKRVVECLFTGARLCSAEAKLYEHPMRAAEIEWRGSTIGRLFEIHPKLLEQEGLGGRAVLFDVDLDVAQSLAASRVFRYTPPRRYPTSGFDLSVISELRLPVSRIQDELAALAGSDLASLDFVRQYAGPPLPEGSKSVSYHLEIGALDRTMTADELTAIRNRIIQGMRGAGYELRV